MANNASLAAVDDLATRQFRAFYEEVVKVRDRTSQSRETDIDLVAQAVGRHLENFLELQTLESRRESTRFDLENIADARYLKAALADEILLTSVWIGRDIWTRYLLESSIFRTNIAGEQVFRRVEELLSQREPSTRNLARLYLFTLSLGFSGKFRGSQESDILRSYREELFEFVYQRQPELTVRDRVVNERAYANTLSHIVPNKLPNLSRWSVAVLLAAVSLLAVSEILWLWQSWPVRQALSTSVISNGLGGLQ